MNFRIEKTDSERECRHWGKKFHTSKVQWENGMISVTKSCKICKSYWKINENGKWRFEPPQQKNKYQLIYEN